MLQLPDLAVAAQLWLSDEYQITVTGTQWDLLVKANIRRWYLAICPPNAGGFIITTNPDSAFQNGIDNAGAFPTELEYQKYSTILGKSWYIYSKGFAGTITYYESIAQKTRPSSIKLEN